MESVEKQNAMEFGGIQDVPEDDAFYEELRRQVLILTAEDDEECRGSEHRNAAKSLQPRFSPVYHYYWSGCDAMDSEQRWPVNMWKSGTGSGTGVFIPQAGKSRRRSKRGKKGSEKGRAFKPAQNVA